MAVCKVPTNPTDALKSQLMGMMEKKRVINMYKFINGVDANDTNTWGGIDLNATPFEEVYKKFGIQDSSKDFLGHAIALHSDDNYVMLPALDTVMKMQLYLSSQGRYGESPFLYPIYGLGGLPEAFSRLCAIHGGTYMLNTNPDEITFNEQGKVTGIRVGENFAMAPMVICDPSYTTEDKLLPTSKVVRAICLLDHPIPNTNDAQSIQIILPAGCLERGSGKYKFKLKNLTNIYLT